MVPNTPEVLNKNGVHLNLNRAGSHLPPYDLGTQVLKPLLMLRTGWVRLPGLL